MRKRLWILLLAGTLCLGVAQARAESYTLDVGQGPVRVAANMDDPTRVDITNGALAFTGVLPAEAHIIVTGRATVSESADAPYILLENVSGALDVTLSGVSVADGVDDGWGALAILYCTDARLTLEGENGLALRGGSAATFTVSNSAVTVRGGGTLNALGACPEHEPGGTALRVDDRSVFTLESGALNLRGGDGGVSNSAFGGDALFCADSLFALAGGSLTAQGGAGGQPFSADDTFYYLGGGCGVSMAMLNREASLTVSGGSLTALGGAGGPGPDGAPGETGFAYVGAPLTLAGAYAEAAARRVLLGDAAESAVPWDEVTPLDAATGAPSAYLFVGP